MTHAVSKVEEARALFQKVCTEAHGCYQFATLRQFADQIDLLLLKGGKTYKDLDETGKSSEMDMIHAVDAALSACHLTPARNLFIDIEFFSSRGVVRPILEKKVDLIEQHLAFVSINGEKPRDWSCLDATGKTSDIQIRARIETAINTSQRKARDVFKLRRVRHISCAPK